MNYTRLGTTGLKVSRLCLGTMTYGSPDWHPWTLDEAASRPFIKRALERGINFFDTADMYSRGASEEVLGRALKDFAAARPGRRRDQGLPPDGRRSERQGPVAQAHPRRHRRVAAAARDGLRRSLPDPPLRLRHADRGDARARSTTSSERARRATSARRACTRGSSPRCSRTSDAHGWARFVSMQNHYNLVYREEEREMMPLCRAEGIGVIPYSPLARGFLAGDRKKGGGGDTVAREQRQARREVLFRGHRLCDRRSRRRDSRSGAASAACRSRWPGCCRVRA